MKASIVSWRIGFYLIGTMCSILFGMLLFGVTFQSYMLSVAMLSIAGLCAVSGVGFLGASVYLHAQEDQADRKILEKE